MTYPAFLVLDGFYNFLTSEAYLYVRIIETDFCLTVGTVVKDENHVKSLIGKIIIGNYISDVYVDIKSSPVREKLIRHYSDSDGEKLWGEESTILLTGQYLGPKDHGDGDISYVVDAVIPLEFASGFDDFTLGDWIELEIRISVLFDKVISVEEWCHRHSNGK